VREDRIDVRREHVGARDFGDAGIDAFAHVLLVLAPCLERLHEDTVDERSFHVERVSGDDRAGRHLEAELPRELLVARIDESGGQRAVGERAEDVEVDAQLGECERGAAMFRIVDAALVRIENRIGRGRRPGEQQQDAHGTDRFLVHVPLPFGVTTERGGSSR